MRIEKQKIKQWYKTNNDIFRFIIVLIASHLFWKYTIIYDESDLRNIDIKWFGIDISAPFVWTTNIVANITEYMLQLFGNNVQLEECNRLVFDNGKSLCIVWACNGIKQIYIFICIILFAHGAWKHKLWFIPLGTIICAIYNLIRIIFLSQIVKNFAETFDFWHEYVTKYIFYSIIFMLWIWWNECYNRRCVHN